MNIKRGATFELINNFFLSYYNGERFLKGCPNNIVGFVISNHTIDWGDKEKLEEEFNDTTYNYFVKLKEPSNKYTNWWKQEYLSKHFETIITKEEKHSECSICLNKINNIVKTKCNHLFCKSCLEKWLDEKLIPNEHNCPLCRKENNVLYPFYQKGFVKNEIYKTCNRTKRTFKGTMIFHSKCNNFFITNDIDNEVCYCCKFDSYLKKMERLYIKYHEILDISDSDIDNFTISITDDFLMGGDSLSF